MTEIFGLFIDGKWETPMGSKSFSTRSPSTGEKVGTFISATGGDARRAIEAAHRAFHNWRSVPAPKRGELLLRAAEIFKRRKDDIGSLVSREMGKILPEGKGDVQEAIDFVEYMSGEGRRLLGETVPSELRNKYCFTIRQPKGVIVAITPWNFPVAIPNWKIAAALITGNTVVFKPASNSSRCAVEVTRVYEEAGLPAGVLNLLTGPGGAVGQELTTNPLVRAVSFTGGTETGKGVYSQAASNLKYVHLEMGGKNPEIVMEDANLDLAIDGLLFGAFGSSGQRCTATSRLILHEGIYEEFLARLLKRLKTFKIGNPLDEGIDMGPVASQDQEKKVLSYIDIGKKEGAKLLCGGKKLKGPEYDRGFFIEPTVFEATHGMRITKEEIFGPVLSVMKVKGFEEAVRIANDVDFGLSSSIYTRDVNLAFQAMEVLEAGITYVNAPTIGAEVQLPFGGVKNTGNGGREAGTVAIDEFTELKTVFVDFSNHLQKAQIEPGRW